MWAVIGGGEAVEVVDDAWAVLEDAVVTTRGFVAAWVTVLVEGGTELGAVVGVSVTVLEAAVDVELEGCVGADASSGTGLDDGEVEPVSVSFACTDSLRLLRSGSGLSEAPGEKG